MILCCFGDSLVKGVGDPKDRGWLGRITQNALRENPDLTVYNLGVRRNTSRDVRARWREETARRTLDGAEMRLLFAFGGVDCMVDAEGRPFVSPEESVDNARSILSLSKALHTTVWIGPPPMADAELTARIEILTDLYAKLAAELEIPFLPLAPELKKIRPYIEDLRAGDGIHPGAVGCDHIARLVAAWDGKRIAFEE